MTAKAATAGGGVRVRGSCAAGHVTETTADKGRVTWQGPCSHDGCQLPVRAKRIPKDEVPPPPPAGEQGGTRVVDVADYDDIASGARDDTGGLAVADTEPAELEPGSPSTEPGDQGPPDPITEHGEPGGRFHRWRQRRRSAAARRPVPYRHPLL